MEKEFSLESILSVTTGTNCTDNFDDIIDLTCFVFNDDTVNAYCYYMLRDYFKDHLLKIHPELKKVCPPKKGRNNIDNYNEIFIDWINEQKDIYGDYLLISEFGKKLNNSYNSINRSK